MITKAGKEAFYKLFERVELDYSQYDSTKQTLSLIVRNARTLARLAVDECNGPWWRNTRDYTSSEMEAWQAELEVKQTRTEARLAALAAELPHVDGKPWTVTTKGDPRGYVVLLVPPTPELIDTLSNTWGREGYGVA